MVAMGALTSATLGSGVVADGLACSPTSPASMNVVVGAGSLTNLAVVDAGSYGSLAANPAPLVKMGINTGSTTLALAAPTTPGYSVTYLIEASFVEAGGNPAVLPYYNAANPSVPFVGPTGSGVAQPTALLQYVALQAKAGVAAATGTQVAPGVDSGWTALYTVTIAYGQTSVGSGNIVQVPGAPFLALKLPQISNIQFNTMVSFTAAGSFVVPAGVGQVRVRLVGGGGGGGARVVDSGRQWRRRGWLCRGCFQRDAGADDSGDRWNGRERTGGECGCGRWMGRCQQLRNLLQRHRRQRRCIGHQCRTRRCGGRRYWWPGQFVGWRGRGWHAGRNGLGRLWRGFIFWWRRACCDCERECASGASAGLRWWWWLWRCLRERGWREWHCDCGVLRWLNKPTL